MDSLLQLCTVALTSTLAWPVCHVCGADPRWLAWHFWFCVWAWVILGGFSGALALADWLECRSSDWVPQRRDPNVYHGPMGIDP